MEQRIQRDNPGKLSFPHKLIVLVISLLILVFIFTRAMNHKQVKGPSSYETWAREHLVEHLKPLPSVDYDRAIGFEPTQAQVNLGRLLFSDPILSRNNDVSCATCHLSNHGFADGNSLNFGPLGQGGPSGVNVGKVWAKGKLSQNRSCGYSSDRFACPGPMHRNSLSTVNVAFRSLIAKDRGLMWDGRFGKLRLTTLLPITTKREMCGTNVVPSKGNPFKKGGYYFKKPVRVSFSHNSDNFTGEDLSGFYSNAETIDSVETFRPDGTQAVPTKNECLAIAITKLRSAGKYTPLFKKAFPQVEDINDDILGRALAAFVATHVSNKTKYDKFVKGKSTLSEKELKGLISFFTPAGKIVEIGSSKIIGVGCISCHKPPTFGGAEFYSIGAQSNPASALTKPRYVFNARQATTAISEQRGRLPNCHISGSSFDESRSYGPDIGRANATYQVADCFKFRVPPLRNIIETFPYYHHGIENGGGLPENQSFGELSKMALKRVIAHHLRGPVNIKQYNVSSGRGSFFDKLFTLDPFVPLRYQTFNPALETDYPITQDQGTIDNLFEFIAMGLWDRESTQTGDLGNDVSHPKSVPSGLSPSISRDQGSQKELID